MYLLYRFSLPCNDIYEPVTFNSDTDKKQKIYASLVLPMSFYKKNKTAFIKTLV